MRLFRRRKRAVVGGLLLGRKPTKRRRAGRGSKILKKLEGKREE